MTLRGVANVSNTYYNKFLNLAIRCLNMGLEARSNATDSASY